MGGKNVSATRAKEYLEAIEGQYAPMHLLRIRRWVHETEEFAVKLATGDATKERAGLFYIRLAGLLVDLRKTFAPLDYMKLGIPAGESTVLGEMRDSFFLALDALHASLSEELLIYIELRRHQDCHPVLNDYAPKFSDDASWNQRMSTILGRKPIDLENLIDRCDKMEQAAGGAAAFTRALAARLVTHLGEIRGRFEPIWAYFSRR